MVAFNLGIVVAFHLGIVDGFDIRIIDGCNEDIIMDFDVGIIMVEGEIRYLLLIFLHVQKCFFSFYINWGRSVSLLSLHALLEVHITINGILQLNAPPNLIYRLKFTI